MQKNHRCEYCTRKAVKLIVYYGDAPNDKHKVCEPCFQRFYEQNKIKLCSIPRWEL